MKEVEHWVQLDLPCQEPPRTPELMTSDQLSPFGGNEHLTIALPHPVNGTVEVCHVFGPHHVMSAAMLKELKQLDIFSQKKSVEISLMPFFLLPEQCDIAFKGLFLSSSVFSKPLLTGLKDGQHPPDSVTRWFFSKNANPFFSGIASTLAAVGRMQV